MLQPKPNVAKMLPSRHGGIDYAELERLGISPQSVMDFSVSTNPFGPPPGIAAALSRAPVDRYPDSDATKLRLLLARKLKISPDNILVGSGSTELIRLVAAAYFGPGDPVVIPQPTYSEYEVACNLADARVLKMTMPEETGFRLKSAGFADFIKKHQPKGIFLCNPNNPTGQYLSASEVKEILSAAGDSLLILDEAYVAFTENAWPSLDLLPQDNLVILRSMTKDYALAGLRLGYAIAAEPVISVLERVKPPWNVSSAAQAAGVHVLQADGYLDACREKIKEAKQLLIAGLKDMGFAVLPSATNFFLVKVGHAARFRQALLGKGILVRECTSFGLPGYIRLAPRPLTECRLLLAAIKEVKRHDS